MKTLLRRELLARYSYPTHFIKWFVDKFEFQNRGTVHDHALMKLIYLFLKDDKKGKTKDFKPEDFEEIDVHGPKLDYYSSMRKVAHMLVKRIWRRANALRKSHTDYHDKLTSLIESIESHDLWKAVTKQEESIAKTSTPQHNTREPDDEVDQPALPNTTSLEHLLELTKTEKCDEMLTSLHRSEQLGLEADKALIALKKANIHCYDNSMQRYRDEFVENLCDDKNSRLDTKHTGTSHVASMRLW